MEKTQVNRFTIIDCEQRSTEWLAARAGRVTASRAADMLAKIKSGEAAGRRNYRTQLIAERLTGQPQENGFVSAAMQQGIDLEPRAIAAYEALTGALVRKTGFIALNDMAAGCSLDGDVDDFKTILSVKCPQPPAHLEYLWERRLPPRYIPQATHEMWITGAQHYDFVSYNEAYPENLQLFYVRVNRNEFDVANHAAEVVAFLKEIDVEVRRMNDYKPGWVA